MLAELAAEEAALDRLERETQESYAERVENAEREAEDSLAKARDRIRAEMAAARREALEAALASREAEDSVLREKKLALGAEISARMPAAVDAILRSVFFEEPPR